MPDTIPLPADQPFDVSADLQRTFITKDEVQDVTLSFTITSVERVTFEARNNRPAETKWALVFGDGEPVRKLALNKGNLEICAKAWGKDARAWINRDVDVFYDEGANGGKGAVRVRIPKPVVRRQVAPTPAVARMPLPVPPTLSPVSTEATETAAVDDGSDSVPF